MIQLRDYQQDAVKFFQSKSRAILADQVGLGKTLPTIEAASHYSGPRLVVAPPYLLRQWETEIVRYLGPDERITILNRKDPPVQPDDVDWVLVGYHTMMNGGITKHPELLAIKWSVVIFDESHRLRGRRSQWTKNAYKLRADRMWFLSGTPIVNNPGDMWPILKLCEPNDYRSYWRFVNDWCETTQNPWTTEIHGIKKGYEEAFHTMLDNYLLRRRIEDHLPELPEVIDHRLVVDLPPAMKKLHDTAKKDWFIEHPDLNDPVAIANGGSLITKLRQITAGYTVSPTEGVVLLAKTNPKIDTIKELLDDHPNDAVVVFCWYRETAHRLYAAWHQDRWTALVTGNNSPERRAEIVENWKEQPNGVIVATLSALTEGANLQHARMVVFAEHDYLPATIEQATARVRRFGQKYPVNVYHVLCQGTVDESVMRVMEKRYSNIHRALLEDLQGEH